MSLLISLGATALVSTLPIGALFFLPRTVFDSKDGEARVSDAFLNIMLCFSAGSLIGDALLHILPHSMFSEEPTPERLRNCAMSMVVGIVFFFGCELAVRAIHSDEKSTSHDEHTLEKDRKKDKKNDKKGLTQRKKSTKLEVDKSVDHDHHDHQHHHHHHHHHGHSHSHNHTGGILSLFADALHNFTDGLALAVTFEKSFSIGVATAIAILVHEVPHQIGDYAILVKSGFSHVSAIKMQLYTSVSAGVGVVFGYGIVNNIIPGASLIHNDDILCFIGGGFLYVACVTIIPEVLSSGISKKAIVSQSLLQLVSMVIGLVLMAVIE